MSTSNSSLEVFRAPFEHLEQESESSHNRYSHRRHRRALAVTWNWRYKASGAAQDHRVGRGRGDFRRVQGDPSAFFSQRCRGSLRRCWRHLRTRSDAAVGEQAVTAINNYSAGRATSCGAPRSLSLTRRSIISTAPRPSSTPFPFVFVPPTPLPPSLPFQTPNQPSTPHLSYPSRHHDSFPTSRKPV